MTDITELLANYLFVAYGRHRNTNELFEQQRNIQLLWYERANSLIDVLKRNGYIISHYVVSPKEGKKK